MKALIVGSGAREHALVLAALKSPRITAVICAPGNAGIAQLAPIFSVNPTDIPAIVALAKRECVGLVIVGPEAPLVAGLADALRSESILVFGPGAHAAQLEGSKAFSKKFMHAHGVRTGAFAVFSSAEYDEAIAYLRAHPGPIVVKADGLAGGKGVVVADTTDEAIAAVRSMLRENAFGAAGTTVLLEERLSGPEISLHVLTDGLKFAVLGAAQDHKRLGDGDAGPNTGGMGAYAPVADLSPGQLSGLVDELVRPTIAGLLKDQLDFRGVIFLGIMLQDGVPYVLEYNVRFGDPECAILLACAEDDLIPALLATAAGTLDPSQVPPQRGAAIAVVMASHGYPTSPRLGDVIVGLGQCQQGHLTVLHAGTKSTPEGIVTAGGRVLTICASAPSLAEAAAIAYEGLGKISFADAQYRRDIGWRALSSSSM